MLSRAGRDGSCNALTRETLILRRGKALFIVSARTLDLQTAGLAANERIWALAVCEPVQFSAVESAPGVGFSGLRRVSAEIASLDARLHVVPVVRVTCARHRSDRSVRG